jgi:hypothetical protein
MAGRVYKQITGFFALSLVAGCVQPQVATTSNFNNFAPPPVNPATLVGSTPAVLNAEFGQPVLRRIDGTAQVWLYHSAVCGLNLILYPDSAGVPRVSAAVPDSGDPVSCMASLQRVAALEHGSPS